MTRATVLNGMHPAELEFRYRMIKSYLFPSGTVVTGGAIRVGVIFRIDMAAMNILVTIGATKPDIPEVPFFGFFMTGDTGCGKVRTFEPEPALVMLFNSK